uniref:Uncharacterized protein n=1 Tax=Arundo donax TaxID=35708 RepID=A0A0A9EP58_ARUDO
MSVSSSHGFTSRRTDDLPPVKYVLAHSNT